MGILDRIANLLAGKTDRAVEDAEKNDVDAVYRGIITQEEEKLRGIRELARETKGYEFSLNEKIEERTKEKAELQITLDLAIKEKNEEIGGAVIEKIEAIDAEITNLKEQLEAYKKESAEVIEALEAQERHLADLKEEALTAKSTVKSTEILQKIRDRQKGLGLDSSDKSLEIVRNKVASSKAARQADLSMHEQSFEHKMDEFKKKAAGESSKSKFAAMVAEKEAK